jgi:hypothetical protein
MNGNDRTPTLLQFSPLYFKCPGLRNWVQPSDVKVFKMNADGSKGEYLRTEEAQSYYKGEPMLGRQV